jgi:hypothetical protein
MICDSVLIRSRCTAIRLFKRTSMFSGFHIYASRQVPSFERSHRRESNGEGEIRPQDCEQKACVVCNPQSLECMVYACVWYLPLAVRRTHTAAFVKPGDAA